MSEYFYKFKEHLNDKLLRYVKLENKIENIRNDFLKSKGLLEQDMTYYQFTFEPKLTKEQLEILDIPKNELKKNGELRKNSKFMKQFTEDYQDKLISNNIDLNTNPKNKIRWTIYDLFDVNVPSFRFSYAYFERDETVYLKSTTPLKEHDDVVAINGSELYQAFETRGGRVNGDKPSRN